jgi:hypothetical protein
MKPNLTCVVIAMSFCLEGCVHQNCEDLNGQLPPYREEKHIAQLIEARAEGVDAPTLVLEGHLLSIAPWFDEEAVKWRIESALDQWRNGLVDSRPVLLYAVLVEARGEKAPRLRTAWFDENEDVIGVGIVEVRGDTRTILREEQYPVYIDKKNSRFVTEYGDPVRIRQGVQHSKDPVALDESVQSAYGTLDDMASPVWVSIPDPHGIDVFVYVYDREGNESIPFRLVYLSNTLVKELKESGRLGD